MSEGDYMSAYETYSTYLAMQAHFNRGNYDFFKYNGKMKVKEETFLARKDRYFFEKASRKFKKEEFKQFLLANYTSGSEYWIGNLMSGDNLTTLKNWKGRIDSLTYNFKNDLQHVIDSDEGFDAALHMIDGKHPLFYRLFLGRKITLETMVIIEDLVSYSELWLTYNDEMINNFLFLMKKYRPFLYDAADINNEKFRKIILDLYN